jgi:hypothetical protein
LPPRPGRDFSVPKLLAIAQRIPALAGDVQAMAGAALTG